MSSVLPTVPRESAAPSVGGAEHTPAPLRLPTRRALQSMPLRWLLMGALVAILSCSSSLMGLWLARERSQALHLELREKGAVWARILAAHAEYGVLVGDRDGLGRLLHGLRHDSDVVWARVLDADGSVLAEGPGPVVPSLLRALEQAASDGAQEARRDEQSSSQEAVENSGPAESDSGRSQPSGLPSRLFPPVSQQRWALAEGSFLWMHLPVTTFRVRQTPEELALGGGTSVGSGHQERIGQVQLLFSLARVEAAVLDTWRSIGLATGGMVLLGILLALPLTRRIVRPVQALASASRRIASLELSVQIPDSAIREMAELASAFQAMVAGLIERDQHLAANAAELERRADALQVRQEALLVANAELVRLNEALQHLNLALQTQKDALDVSHRALYLKQEQLHESHRELLRTSDLKSAFLATMSHELRTPLNSILGYSQCLLDELDGPLNGEQKDSLERVQRNGQHLLGLINEILDFSRLEAGRLELVAQPFDPSLVAEECLELVRPLARGKPIQLVFEACRLEESAAVGGADSVALFDPNQALKEPLQCIGDASRLRQVLLNLLSNAVYYSESGTVTLRVLLGSGQLELQVVDTGRGIPEDELGAIFEPFRRAKGTPGQGSGLGLPISKRLVEAMGGSLRVRSRVGEGSVFTVWLPVTSGTAPGDEEAAVGV